MLLLANDHIYHLVNPIGGKDDELTFKILGGTLWFCVQLKNLLIG